MFTDSEKLHVETKIIVNNSDKHSRNLSICQISAAVIIWAVPWQNQQCGCAPREDSDQPGHPPSLIRVFAVRMKKARVLSYPLSAQRRFWSDWADAQADLSLCWAHSHIVGFVMSRFIWSLYTIKLQHTVYRWTEMSSLGLLLFWVFLNTGSLKWNALFTVSNKVQWTVHNQLRWQYI